MTYLTSLVTIRGKHRLHERTNNFVTLLSSMATAMAAHLGSYPLPKDSVIGLSSIVFDRHIAFFTNYVVPNAIKNLVPERIELELRQGRDQGDRLTEPKLRTDGFQKIFYQIVAPTFIDFYENHKQWLYDNVNKKSEKWPPTLNFGRVIRNSMSHGNKIWFDSQNAASAEWYNLKYSSLDNGRPVVLHDMSIADVIILMFEMSDELDKRRCPLF